MDRRRFLVGLGSASVGGSALLGSGAFSRVEAQRSVTIQVAEDPDAYLGMDKCSIGGSETPNSSYAHLDGNGHLEILMNPDNPTIGETDLGEGINSDSRMWADNVFQLCNQGKENACIWIEDYDDELSDPPEPYEDERRVDFYLGDNRDRSIVGEDNAIGLPLGECVCIGLKTNSKGLSEGDELLEELDNEIRIVADVDGDCTFDPEEITETGRISLAYEDLPKDESDWDYNDWVVDIDGTFTRRIEDGEDYVTNFLWNVVPQARLAGDSHTFEFEFDCGGEYTVTYYDNEGESLRDDSSSFSAGTVAIEVWDDTDEVLDTLDEGDDACVIPDEWAQIDVNFDEPGCDFETLGDTFACHGSDLPFNPILENNDKDVTVERGDIRLLVVNEEWSWPTEGTAIWDAYGGVDEDDDGRPDFGEDCDLGDVTGDVVECNIAVQLDNSLEIENDG
ncbi:hypothetical protein RH858_05075 [Halalkaliarchaeum sp. AArc-GB]|uniref:hypothetical protein n=1 Tax=Halalkaliarchaeum sp. AArc-GB TaxID=3074078 RepID=UPI00285DEB65|nr:hypothetical protein [Halalkaliarchaeum sp. AArc-GB]MDR5672522.1 hypothetical protein [Halalkaliarchaeum sp. AArc-GB]